MHLINSELPSRDLVIHCREIWGLSWVTLVMLLWLHRKDKCGGGHSKGNWVVPLVACTGEGTEHSGFFGWSLHAGWHFSLMLRPFNPRWPIISSQSFKGSRSTPLIYPHLPLMSFKRREIVALCNKPCCQSVLLKLHWLCGKLKINDLLARWGERVCMCLTKKERDWGMRVLVCAHTLHSHLADH